MRAKAECICGRPVSPEHAPFCSARCRDRDLLNWLGDAYVIPGEPADPFSDPRPSGDWSPEDPSEID